MAEMIYRTTTSMRGPWLVDSSALDSLDEILDSELEKLKSESDRELDKEIRRAQSELRSDEWHQKLGEEKQKEKEKELKERTVKFSQHARYKREVVATLNTDEKLRASRMSEVIRQPLPQSARIDHLKFEVHCGEFQASIAFPQYSDEYVAINVTPAGKQESAEFFVRLEQWAQGIALPRWIGIWKTYNGLHWCIFIFILLLLFPLGTITSGGSKDDIRKQATALLNRGISPTDEQQALTLILSFLAEYPHGPPKTYFRPWFLVATGMTMLACILLSFRPKSAIGIGNGKISIARWRRWIKFISIVIPGFEFMGVLSSTIGSALYEVVRPYLLR